MRRATATVALVLATGLGLTACSSDGSDGSDGADAASDDASASAPASSPSASPSAAGSSAAAAGGSGDIAPADVAALALTAPDFPAPYTYTELPPGALEQGGAAVSGALGGATFDPAECGAAAAPNAKADLSQAGVAIGADQSTGASIAEVLTPSSSQEIPDYAAQAKACKNFTFTLDSPAGPATGKASVTLLEAPDVEADRVQAAQTTVQLTIGGQSQTIDTTVYTAELRGVVVIVTGSGPAGAAIDTSVLDQLFSAGVDKVAAG